MEQRLNSEHCEVVRQDLNPLPDNFYDVVERYRKKELSSVQAAKECGMSKSTFYARLKDMESPP